MTDQTEVNVPVKNPSEMTKEEIRRMVLEEAGVEDFDWDKHDREFEEDLAVIRAEEDYEYKWAVILALSTMTPGIALMIRGLIQVGLISVVGLLTFAFVFENANTSVKTNKYISVVFVFFAIFILFSPADRL